MAKRDDKQELRTVAPGGPAQAGNGALYDAAPKLDAGGYTMMPGHAATWPPAREFRARYEARFAREGFREAEYVVALMEWEVVSGNTADADALRFFGYQSEQLAAAVTYWRLFWAFPGPLYKRFRIEFYSEPGGPAWRVQTRRMEFIPEHVRVENVDAYWRYNDRDSR